MQINISENLTNRLKHFIDSGVFASFDDAAEAALNDRIVMEEWILQNKNYIRDAIEEGIVSLEKGDCVTLEEARKIVL